MKIEDNKIVEATEDELFGYYLQRDLDECFSFADYLRGMKKAGVKIVDKTEYKDIPDNRDKQGSWIHKKYGVTCSECNLTLNEESWYCPLCGARMV